jgi:hypothetical protein
VTGCRADEVVVQARACVGRPWRRIRLERQTLGKQSWQVKAARVWAVSAGQVAARSYWLIWAQNEVTGEEKYFVSNGSERVSLATLLRVAFARWQVEHGLRLAKSEAGLGHYEGRHYLGLLRHQTLCLVVLAFASLEAAGWRGEKPGGDSGAGVPGLERGVRGLAGGVTGDEPGAVHGQDHPISPAQEPAGAGIKTPRTEKTPVSTTVAL